jgi:hypothetical protein
MAEPIEAEPHVCERAGEHCTRCQKRLVPLPDPVTGTAAALEYIADRYSGDQPPWSYPDGAR